jgi:hypothetical protein
MKTSRTTKLQTEARPPGLYSTKEACQELGIGYHVFINRAHMRGVRPILSIRNKHWWHPGQFHFLCETDKEFKQSERNFFLLLAKELLGEIAGTTNQEHRLHRAADFLSRTVILYRDQRDPDFCRRRILHNRQNPFSIDFVQEGSELCS